MSEFERELEQLINRHSQENGSHSPDFILAEYLVGCLETFNKAVRLRDNWWGHEPWANRDGELLAP